MCTKNKFNFIQGTLLFDNGKFYVDTLYNKFLIKTGDILTIRFDVSHGLFLAKKLTLNDLHKQPHRLSGELCFLFPGPSRRLIYYKNGIAALFDYKPGQKITVVSELYETSTRNETVNIPGELLDVSEDLLSFKILLDNGEEREFRFNEIICALDSGQKLTFDYITEKEE